MNSKNIAGITDKGQKRNNNEDCFIAENLNNTSLYLAAVIDGVGGYEGGEVASALTRERILEYKDELTGNFINGLKAAISEANKNIYASKEKDATKNQMACVLTAVVADVANNKFYYAHVGDTRLYLLRDYTLVKISHDHSPIGFLEETGRLTESAAMKHPRRNEINKALGFQADIDLAGDFIEASESPFLPGDKLMLCSDGLTDMIDGESIRNILLNEGSLETKAQQLVILANEAGGEDNITVVIIQHDATASSQTATKPRKVSQPSPAESKSQPVNTVTTEQKTETPTRKKKSSVIPLLILLVVGLACLSTWLWINKEKEPAIVAQTVAPISQPNEMETDLAGRINSPGQKSITLSGMKDIILTAPVVFSNDSVIIHGSGTRLQADSNFKGPAFVFPLTTKYILLDSLVFSGFNTALSLSDQLAILQHLIFNNCQVHIQQETTFRDSVVSTVIQPRPPFSPDTLR